MGITIQQLSRLCEVSTAAVSLVLSHKDRGRVGAVQRARILRAAKKHGYRSNPMAKGLAEGRTYRIALAIEGMLSEHAIIGQFSFYDRLGLVAKALREHGYAIEIVQVPMTRTSADLCRDLSRMAADGFMLLTWGAGAAKKVLLSLRKKRIPAVACGTALTGARYSWADVDRKAAFVDATQRLLREGYRQIALLDCMANRTFSETKEEGFLQTLRGAAGIDAAKWVFRSPGASHEEAVSLAGQALRQMKGVRAFLLTDNFYGDAVLHTLRQAGLHPGQDCRVIGFGDTPLADRCTPRLSHYSLQVEDQVAFCVTALLDEIRTPLGHPPRCRLFEPRLIQRET
jgi:LacI family transcriptional regulator